MSPIIPNGAHASRYVLSTLSKGAALTRVHLFPRRMPRSQLRPTPILRRAALSRPHQRRGFATDHASTAAIPSRVVALPLSHRPLLPGMTIQLQVHDSLYNKIVTDLHVNRSSMVGAFLAQTFGSDGALPKQHPLRLGPKDPRFVTVNGVRRRVPNRLPVPTRIDRSLVASQFVDVPSIEDIHKIGTLCRIVEMTPKEGLLIESIRPVVARSVADKALLIVDIEPRNDILLHNNDANLIKRLKNDILSLAQHMASRRHLYANHLRVVVERARAAPDRTNLSMLVNQVAGLCTSMSPDQEQRLVEELDPIRRAALFLTLVSPSSIDK